jgi:hypothetical protein
MRRNGHDGRKNVLYAMMELADQQALQLLHRLAFGSVHARLLQKAAQVQILGLKPQLLFRFQRNLSIGLARTYKASSPRAFPVLGRANRMWAAVQHKRPTRRCVPLWNGVASCVRQADRVGGAVKSSKVT